MPGTPSGASARGHCPRSPSPSPTSRRSPPKPKPSAINIPRAPAPADPPTSRSLSSLTQSLGRATLTSHRRAAIDEWMRGLASSPHAERADTPASVVSSAVTSDSAPSPSLRSRSRTISTTSMSFNNPISAHPSACPSQPAQHSPSHPHPTPAPARPLPAGNVSARAAHFNALARAATVSTPSPMKSKGRREPGFARPTRSSSAKVAKVVPPTLGVSTSTGASVGASPAASTMAPPSPSTAPTTAPPSPHQVCAAPTESEPDLEPQTSGATPGLRPLLLPTGSAPERRNPAPQSTVRKRLSLVPYKVDSAPDEVHPLQLSHPASPARPRHHRRHSSMVYKKSEPFAAFPSSPSTSSSELHLADPEDFLDGSRSEPDFRERRHDTIVSGNLERRESILRSIVRMENRERELREAMERRGYEPPSGGIRRLSLQGRPARRRSTPCMPSTSPIEDSPVALASSRKLEASPPPPSCESPPPLSPQLQLGAEELLATLEPQVTRETDISSAPTTLGLTGPGSRSSLLRPSSMSTATTDEEPRVRFATPDDMRAQFRRQIHRESTLAQLTGPPRSRPPVEILDHSHLAAMLSKQNYAGTVTPATSVTTSVASAESLPRYRRRAEPDPAPDYVASAYTGDATAGIEANSGFGRGGEEAPGAAATAPGPTRRCTPSTFCGAGGAELDKLVHDEHRFIAVGDVDPLDHLLPETQEGPSLFTALGRWFCPVDGS